MGAGAAAGICLVAVVLLYHIPLGDTLGADALHALGAAVVALVCSQLGGTGAASTRTRHGGDAGMSEARAQIGSADAVSTCTQSGGASAVMGAVAGTGALAGATLTRTQGNSAGAGVDAGTRTRHGSMGVTVTIASLCLLAALAVTLASVAGGAGSPEFANLDAALAAVPLVALSCLATAVWEETFFRKLALDAVSEALAPGKLRDLQATCACAAVFALMHMGQAADLAQEALRFAQVFLFGLAMGGLRAQTGALGWSIGVHAAYDLVCFLPAALTWQAGYAWEMPTAALAAVEVGVPGILASLVVLVPAAALAARELVRR